MKASAGVRIESLRWRLLTVFLLLALATTGAFVFGTQRALVAGWQGWVKPIVADHLDRLVDEIGSPPSGSSTSSSRIRAERKLWSMGARL